MFTGFISFSLTRFSAFAVLILLLGSCRSGPDLPDVSGLPAAIEVRRFDSAFFALDTINPEQGLQQLMDRYPDFFPQYLSTVLGINPAQPDAVAGMLAFLSSYRGVFDSAQLVMRRHQGQLLADLALGIQYMQHYFPKWKPEQPFVVTTFVGPMDAYEPFAIGDYGDVRTSNGVGIALQLHLGGGAAIYEMGRQAGVLFDYQTRRFTPDMMVVNAMKNVIEDAYPYKPAGLTLVEEMIEKGKRLYALKKVLPHVPDSLQLGYTADQLKGCAANEALIWNYFVKNDLLYSKDMLVNQSYIKDGPKTAELGEGAPGYIGLWVGLRLVESFMEKQPGLSLDSLMKTPAKQLFDAAGYKP